MSAQHAELRRTLPIIVRPATKATAIPVRSYDQPVDRRQLDDARAPAEWLAQRRTELALLTAALAGRPHR